MVARPWGWDTPFMLGHFGWRSLAAIAASNADLLRGVSSGARRVWRRVRQSPTSIGPKTMTKRPSHACYPCPAWLTLVHMLFMAWTVMNAHYPVLFVGGFLIFLGVVRATSVYQSRLDLKAPLLVGFFLAGLVIHGGLQGWWIAPVLASLSEQPLFFGATILTAFNDNALITYLATLVPNLSDGLKAAVVEGAVTGGGLTVIANAPNPAGQAILNRFFDGGILPVGLLLGAIIPTIVAVIAFRFI